MVKNVYGHKSVNFQAITTNYGLLERAYCTETHYRLIWVTK